MRKYKSVFLFLVFFLFSFKSHKATFAFDRIDPHYDFYRPTIQPSQKNIECTWLHCGSTLDTGGSRETKEGGHFTQHLLKEITKAKVNNGSCNLKDIMSSIMKDCKQHPQLDFAHATKEQSLKIDLPIKKQEGRMVRSVHFGVNKFSRKAYGFDVEPLIGCAKDAKNMAESIKSSDTRVFVNNECTKESFFSELNRLSAISTIGDYVVITVSSHGTWATDKTGMEVDGRSEATCFYDGVVWDFQIVKEFSKFKTGVTLITIWDACHSGTATR